MIYSLSVMKPRTELRRTILEACRSGNETHLQSSMAETTNEWETVRDRVFITPNEKNPKSIMTMDPEPMQINDGRSSQLFVGGVLAKL